MKRYGRRHGIWMGAGAQSERTSFITRCWLRTTLPPYMMGSGISFAVGHKSIRIGTYKVLGFLDPSDYDDVDVEEELQVLEAIGWRAGVGNGREIGSWKQPQSAPVDSPTRPSPPVSAPSSSVPPTSTSGPSPSP